MYYRIRNVFVSLTFIFATLLPQQIIKAESSQISTTPSEKNIFTSTFRQSPEFVEGEVIVKYKKDKIDLKNPSGRKKAERFGQEKSLEKIDDISDSNIQLFKSQKTTEQTLTELKNHPDIELAEPNYNKYPATTPPNDTYFGEQWALSNIGQAVNGISGAADADIDMPEAWDLENGSNDDITVAVIDTGVRFTHEDLTANMWDGSVCEDEFGASISGGCPNHGWDYKSSDNNPDDSQYLYCFEEDIQGNCIDEQDISGHGTFISGIIGAQHDNGKGVSGISSRNKIKVMAIRFNLDTFSELKAISFAKNNGAKVINASFGGSEYSQLEKNAIDSFPGLFVAAAGNDSDDNEMTHSYPSDYISANIISVAATNQNDTLASFSNYGNVSVDIAAPGTNITSTSNVSDTLYAEFGAGTSYAAPYVSASTAMLFSANPTLTIAATKNIILSSGDPLASLSGKTVSGKRLNINNASQLALKVAIPIASTAGGNYTQPKSITLTSATTDAEIFYTLDGSTPTTSSTPYSSSLSISSDTTLKAIATKSGLLASDVSTDVYTFENSTPVHRFWSNQKQGHFFTSSSAEKDSVIANDPSWKYEGMSFSAFGNSASEATPVYRFWSQAKQHHFYTVSAAEKNNIIANDPSWKYETISYYAYANNLSNTTAVYRFWSEKKKGHFFTASEGEKNNLIVNDPSWNYEGVAWYVPTN